jgi:Zn-dependent peptidase ImmA (M78 family)
MSFAKYHAKSLMKKFETKTLPIDPYKIAEEVGILIREDDCEGYTGMLLVVSGQALISVKVTIREYPRKRFTVAHELGHFHIPGHITKERDNFKCTDKDLNTFAKENDKESEANEFAAELLMPEDIFRDKIRLKDLSYYLLQNLTDEFETSLTATGIRFVELSGDHALICSENSRIKWFVKGEKFPFFINAIGNLSDDSIAIEHFKGEELPKSFEPVPANAWLDDYRLKKDAEVQELSIALRHYNQVLSFLYIEGFEEDDDEYLEELNGYPKFKR